MEFYERDMEHLFCSDFVTKYLTSVAKDKFFANTLHLSSLVLIKANTKYCLKSLGLPAKS